MTKDAPSRRHLLQALGVAGVVALGGGVSWWRAVRRPPPRGLFPQELDLDWRGRGDAGLLFIGNSRVHYPLASRRRRLLVARGAGLPAAATGLASGPGLQINNLKEFEEKLRAWRPTLIGVQVDAVYPVGPGGPDQDATSRLHAFSWSAAQAEAAVALLSTLGADRVVAFEVPLPHGVYAALGADWQERRRRAHRELETRGVGVLGAELTWEDSLFVDGIHLDPTGEARFLAWLGQQLLEP